MLFYRYCSYYDGYSSYHNGHASYSKGYFNHFIDLKQNRLKQKPFQPMEQGRWNSIRSRPGTAAVPGLEQGPWNKCSFQGNLPRHFGTLDKKTHPCVIYTHLHTFLVWIQNNNILDGQGGRPGAACPPIIGCFYFCPRN